MEKRLPDEQEKGQHNMKSELPNTTQPIEEKWNWQEEFDRRFKRENVEEFGIDLYDYEQYIYQDIISFIENLLEQEKKIMAGAIEMSKQGWIDEGRVEERKRMSEAVKEKQKTVRMEQFTVDTILSIINK